MLPAVEGWGKKRAPPRDAGSLASTSLRRERPICVNKALYDLIEAGWQVIESDFDPDAFLKWRKRALNCVVVLMGPDHTYTQYFDHFVSGDAKNSLLTGAGILEATRGQGAMKEFKSDRFDFGLHDSDSRDGGNA